MSHRFRMVLAVTLLALAGCNEDAAELPPAGEELVAQRAAQCEAKGGRWGEGLKGTMTCFQKTRDANDPCETKNDCEGFCLARSRSCAPVTPLFGCNDVLGVGGAESTVCIQ